MNSAAKTWEFWTSAKWWLVGAIRPLHPGVFYKDICDPAGKARQSNLKSPADYMKQLGIMVTDGQQDFKIRREMVAKRLI